MDYLIMRRVTWAIALLLSGCSNLISNKLADTLSSPGKTYARDDDPELVRAAVPFVLKTMEQLHESVPNHVGLSQAMAQGFTSFAVAFVADDADRLAEKDMAAARFVYQREKRLALRGFRYGVDGLAVAIAGSRPILESGSREDRDRILKSATKEQVGLLYWTAAGLGSAISADKTDMKMVGQLPLVEQLMHRALELDESFDNGALHEFYLTWYAGHSKQEGGGPEKAREELQKARALSGNKKLAPLVSFAESVLVDQQKKAEFEKLLQEVLAFDVDSAPDFRLTNTLAQRRARWLLGRISDLFAE
jgi:predicted anti-sigma-YlaC factor YlaD